SLASARAVFAETLAQQMLNVIIGGVGEQGQVQSLTPARQFLQMPLKIFAVSLLETPFVGRDAAAGMAIADGQAGIAGQLPLQRIKYMYQCDVGVPGQFKQLLFAGRVKVVEVADDKQGTAGFGDASGVRQYVHQFHTVCRSRRRLQAVVVILQLMQQLQHGVLAAPGTNIALGVITEYQTAYAIAVAQRGPA